jgi:WD40 repeat protein
MILFSHERQCFSRTNKRSHDADRLHPFRILSRIETLAYLIRTLLRFAAQRERGFPGALLAAAATGRCNRGIGHRRPVGSPPTSHTDIVVSVGFSPGRTLVLGGWDKSVRLWDVASHLACAVLVQPIFELVLQAALT